MKGLYLIDIRAAETIAAMRTASKNGLKSQKILGTNPDLTGAVGEMAFSQFSGLPVDTEVKKGGDGGIDFELKVTVDVKTASYRPRHMLVGVGKVRAAIYVQAVYVKPCNVDFLGWMWGYKVLTYPIDDNVQYKLINHLVPVEDLYPMAHIRKFLPTWNQ